MIVVLSIISILCALVYGIVLTHREPGLLRTTVKTVATLCLAIISIWMDGPIWLTLALCFGALGDAFLSLDPDKDFLPGSGGGFLPGLGSFLLGHGAYVLLIWPAGGGFDAIFESIGRTVGAALVLLLAGFVLKQLWGRIGELRVPVLIYIALIAAMGLAALTLPFTWPLTLAVAAAASFIISDFLLSQQLFVLAQDDKRVPMVATLLWAFYWAAQVLFLAAFLL